MVDDTATGARSSDSATTFAPLYQPTSSGKKYDIGKAPVYNGFFRYFPRAIKRVALVSLYGTQKYSLQYEDVNWARVTDGFNRYSDADARHIIDEFIDGPIDPESELEHAAQHAWNAMARLELMLREKEAKK